MNEKELSVPRRHLAQLGLSGGRPIKRPVEAGAPGYPRPLLRRADWTSLDGTWSFALDPEASYRTPREVRYDAQIQVPYAPETRKSGIHDTGLYKACWYRRELTAPPLESGERLLLHFGAVDYEATVWVDGAMVGSHEGGYTPFTFDISRHLTRDGVHELIVRAEDDPADLAKPRGKQDWQLEPHSIWYPRTTGIWLTPWVERVARAHLAELRWTPNMTRWEIGFDALVDAPAGERFWLALRLHAGDVVLAEDRYAVVAGEVHRRIALSDPGIDDFRNELLWSPSVPRVIDADIELLDEQGRTLDAVASYCALRSFAIENERFVLNGRPYALRMVLDQGYWPETGMTPPDDDALRKDVELTKAMGFNGVRKHQKLEDQRYLYWADHLGLLVWTEMPSAYRFTRRSVERLTRQWVEVMRRDVSHPCVIAWVPFNESWGVPNLPDSQPERHYIQALYHLTKTLDPTRPVIGNDGWESVATDILGIHDYDASPERIASRYATLDALPKILERERPGGRALVLGENSHHRLPIVLSEFGGIALADDGPGTWGYSTASARELGGKYTRLLEAVRDAPVLAGFCYTQLTDTYQEANGLLRADRTPKVPLEQLRRANVGDGAYEPSEGAAPVSVVSAEVALTERGGAPR